MSLTSSGAVLSSSFRYTRRRSFWGGFLWSRMQLFEDRIEFAGWGWTGRHRRTVPLTRVKDLRWHTGGEGINFVLHLHAGAADGSEEAERRGKASGEHIGVHVETAGLWKYEVEARAPNLDPAKAALPDEQRASKRARAA